MTCLDAETFQRRDAAHHAAPGIVARLEAAGELAAIDAAVAKLPMLTAWVRELLCEATKAQASASSEVDQLLGRHGELTYDESEAARYLLWDRVGVTLDELLSAAESFIEAHGMGPLPLRA